MNICIACGFILPEYVSICPHHMRKFDDWSINNRIICNFIHRGEVPQRLKLEDRFTSEEIEALNMDNTRSGQIVRGARDIFLSFAREFIKV